MSKETPRLRPAREIEPEESLRAYFSSLPPERQDVGRELSYVISTVWQRSVEAAWPSALRLARSLAKNPGPSVGGWTFRQVDDGNPWHVSFAAESAGSESGFLFTCVLAKEPSEAALARETVRMEEISTLENADERRAAVAKMLLEEISDSEAGSEADPDEYADPATVMSVEDFTVHAYRKGDQASFYDGHAVPLETLLASVAKESYSHGTVATCSPTDDIWQDERSASGSDWCSETATTLLALSVLEKGLSSAGLMEDVRERARSVSSWSYFHFGDSHSALLTEAAQCAVHIDSGFAGPHSFETVLEFWKEAACHDLSRIAGNVAKAAAMLRGHDGSSVDCAYEFNDLDNEAFVTPLSNGVSTLWLKTQHGGYGILFREDENGHIDHFSFARVNDGWGKAASAISPDVDGFLGAFNASEPDHQGRRRFNAFLMGRFSDRTIRDLNNILLTLDSMHCCLEEDAEFTARP